MNRLIKGIFIISILALFSAGAGAETMSKCFIDIQNPDNIEPEVVQNLSKSLITKYIEKVDSIPRAGIAVDKCVYLVAVKQSNSTLLVTISGKNISGIGESKKSGYEAIHEAILKAVFDGNREKRSAICRDFEHKLKAECKGVYKPPKSATGFPGVKIPAVEIQGGELPKGICSVPQANRDYRHCDLERKRFRNVDLSGADFSGIDLQRAEFHNCNLSETRFKGSDLERAVFKNSSLDTVDLSSTNLERARFINSSLSKIDFTKSKLQRAIFKDLSLNQIILISSELERANFSGSTLNQVDLSGADLENAIFNDATLNQVNLTGANLEEVDFSNSNLNNVVR